MGRDIPVAPFTLVTAEDMMAYIPHALGVQPAESAVFLIMTGKTLAATMRLDLPVPYTPLWVEQVVDLLDRVPGCDRVFLVTYSERPVTEFVELAQELEVWLDRTCRALVASWHVTGGRYFEHLHLDDGVVLPDLALNPVNLHMVVAGSAPDQCYPDGSEVPGWDNAGDVRDLVDAGSITPWRDYIPLWGTVLNMAPKQAHETLHADDRLAADLLLSLRVKPVRDVVLYMATSGVTAAMQAWVETQGIEPQGKQYRRMGTMLLGECTVPPDWERVDKMDLLLRDLLGVAEDEPRAAALCMLAWIEWAKGRGGAARPLVKSALREVPDHKLAGLLARLMDAGVVPSWVTDPSKAWHRSLDGATN